MQINGAARCFLNRIKLPELGVVRVASMAAPSGTSQFAIGDKIENVLGGDAQEWLCSDIC